MRTEPDEVIWRLQRERNLWRGIAIAFAVLLVMLLGLGGIGGLLLAKRSQAVLAERARMEAMRQREQAERALQEARRAVDAKRAKLP